MTVTYILDSDNNPVHCPYMVVWGEFMEDIGRRTVKKTQIGESEVSTVFLGLDHNYTGKGYPILFETMVFGPLNPDNDIQERYCTWNEALAGHEEIIKKLKGEL